MREISRRTEGPSKPPTLRIHLSFSLLRLPTSCVLPFSQLTHLFLRRALGHLSCFSPFPLPVLSVPFPALHLDQNAKFLAFSVPGFSGDWNEQGLAFLWPDIYNCRVELWNVKWIKGNRYLGEREHLAAGYVIKTCRLKIGAALERGGTLLWAVFAVFPWIVLNFYDWQCVQPQTLNSGQET